MSILSQLSQIPVKTSPDVWIHRLALLSKITPEPEYIREVITFRKGLNVVWAEEPEAEEDGGDIAGHSAGKTTLCRIIRYVLGEKTFSNKANMLAIRKAFPTGYVAAEVHVRNQRYAVLRPLGDNRNSYVLKNGTLEEILKEKGDFAYQDNYPVKLGLDDIIENFETRSIVRTNEPIQWGHLIAWSARDQEARFQNIYDWRSPRSESDWPSFRFPKSDPLFVMRVALGLFLRTELESEESLAEKLRLLATMESDLEKARKEPEYWRDHLIEELRTKLTPIFPDEKSAIDNAPLRVEGLFPDLERLKSRAVFVLEEQQGVQNAQIERHDESIADYQEELALLKLDLRRLQVVFEVDAAATGELKAAQTEDQAAKEKIENSKHQLCPYGNLLVGRCSHVVERQNILSAKSKSGDKATAEELEKREIERKKLDSQIAELNKSIKQKSNEIQQIIKARDALKKTAEVRSRMIESLTNCLNELLLWNERASNPKSYEKLTIKSRAIDSMRETIAQQQESLNKQISDHDENRDLLSKIFSTFAKAVLPSASYNGVVGFQDRELNFQIKKKGTMTGEAMETLAVLLADLTCLFYNSLSVKSTLPGIMIHDSPREADLGLRLYHRFIRFAASLEQEFRTNEECPFQYILTTTTPPPEVVKKSGVICLQLDASTPEGLLFKKDLSIVPEDEQLLAI